MCYLLVNGGDDRDFILIYIIPIIASFFHEYIEHSAVEPQEFILSLPASFLGNRFSSDSFPS